MQMNTVSNLDTSQWIGVAKERKKYEPNYQITAKILININT